MIQNNITFESVKTTGFGISSKPVVFKENGFYSPGIIDNFGGIINAIDIDWNKAILENNIKIETTGELLTYVSNIYNKLNELKNIPVLKSFNINNDSTINLYPNAANVNYKSYNSSLELTIKDLDFYTNATATLNDLQFSYTYDDVITFNNSVITGVKNGSTSFNVKYVGNKTLGYASPFDILQKTININSSYLIEKIEINDINEDIYTNSSVALSINYTPADKIKEDFKNVVWSVKHNDSSEINAATISIDGKLRVNHKGSVTVTASHNNLISTTKTFNVQTTDAFINILTDGTKQDFINTTYTEEPQFFTIIVDKTSNNFALDEIQWGCTDNAGIEIIETNLDKITIKITKAVQNAQVSATINGNSIHGACSDFITINVEKATQTIGTNEPTQQLTYNESFKVNTNLAKGAITYDYDKTKLSVDTNGNVKAISGTGSTSLKIKATATENYKAAEQTINIELQKATQRIGFNSNIPSSSIDISDTKKYDFSVNGAKTNVYYTITTLSNNDGINYAEKIAWFWGTVNGGEITSKNNGLIKAHAYGKFKVTAYAEETDNYLQSEILVSNEITINRIIVNNLTIYADYKSSDGFYYELNDNDDFTITEDINNMPILYISSRSNEVTYYDPPINFEWEAIEGEGNVDLVQINENIQNELTLPISSLIRLNVKNPGKVTIKCSFKNHWKYELSGNSENTITIYFLPIDASITASVNPAEIKIGDNSQITVVDTAAEKRNNYIYTAHDTHITINETGKITGNASCDNCVITVTSPAKGKYAETSTTTSIKINKKTQNVSVNNVNVTYNAPITTTYSGVKDGARVTWSTTSSLFTIDENTGLITPNSGTGSAQATMRVAETTNYYPIEKPFTVTLQKASQTITSDLNGTLTVDAGETRRFNISGAKTSVNYTTTNGQIAEINTNGDITFNSSGTVTLTAQAVSNDKYNASNPITINVTVNKIDGSSPRITNTQTSLNVDDQITLTYFDPNNRSLKQFNILGVDYDILDNNTIKVTSAGDLKISVTVNSNEMYTEATSSVKTIPVNRIDQPDTVAISGNGSVDVNSSIRLSVEYVQEGADINWTSSNPNVATVNTNGDVFGVKGGEVTITAAIGETRKYNRTTKTLKVTVNKIDGDLPTVTNTQTSIDVNSNLILTYNDPHNRSLKEFNILGVDYYYLDNNTIKVTSAGDLKISVTVNANAMYNEVTSSVKTIKVNKLVQTIRWNTEPVDFTYGTNQTVSVTGGNTNEIYYGSSNTDVATINSSGKMTWKSAGQTTISAYYKGNDYYNQSSVLQKTITVQKANQTINWNTAPTDFTYGTNQTVSATSGNTSVYYGSSNTDVATINSSSGKITWVSAGQTTISAYYVGNSYYNRSAAIEQTITLEKASQTISWNSAPTDFTYGTNQTVSVTGGNTSVYYGSSKPGVATINSSGKMTWVSAGDTIISAYYVGNGYYNSTNPITKTITLEKANQTISWNTEPVDFTYGTNQTVSATGGNTSVYYGSSNTGVATINSSGEITWKSAGQTTISAYYVGNGYYNSTNPITKTITLEKALTTLSLDTTSISGYWKNSTIEKQISYTLNPSNAYISFNENINNCSVSRTGKVTISGVCNGTINININNDFYKGTDQYVNVNIKETDSIDASYYCYPCNSWVNKHDFKIRNNSVSYITSRTVYFPNNAYINGYGSVNKFTLSENTYSIAVKNSSTGSVSGIVYYTPITVEDPCPHPTAIPYSYFKITVNGTEYNYYYNNPGSISIDDTEAYIGYSFTGYESYSIFTVNGVESDGGYVYSYDGGPSKVLKIQHKQRSDLVGLTLTVNLNPTPAPSSTVDPS